MRTEPALPYSFTNAIHTERLTIRLMTPDDVDAVYAYQSREDVCRYLLHGPRTREELEVKVPEWGAATRLQKDDDYFQLAIDLDGRVIGHSYFTIVSVENAQAEIGWTLHPDFEGRGFASEASAAVLDLAFGALGLHRVRAELDPRNVASIALYRRLGMREEAYFVQDLWFKGAWGDTGVYGILASEWKARPLH